VGAGVGFEPTTFRL